MLPQCRECVLIVLVWWNYGSKKWGRSQQSRVAEFQVFVIRNLWPSDGFVAIRSGVVRKIYKDVLTPWKVPESDPR
jgi:hypothetical protein